LVGLSSGSATQWLARSDMLTATVVSDLISPNCPWPMDPSVPASFLPSTNLTSDQCTKTLFSFLDLAARRLWSPRPHHCPQADCWRPSTIAILRFASSGDLITWADDAPFLRVINLGVRLSLVVVLPQIGCPSPYETTAINVVVVFVKVIFAVLIPYEAVLHLVF